MATFQQKARSEALNLIRAASALLQEEKTILASLEECDYFRSIYRSSPSNFAQSRSHAAVPIKQPLILPPKPAPAPLAEPIANPLPSKSAPSLDVERPLSINPETGFAEIQKLLTKIVPEFTFLSDIPSDAKARQIAERWKTKNQSAPISILSFHEPAQQRRFLVNLATALDVVWGPARFIHAEEIEKDNQWEAFLSVPELKLVIIGDYALWQLPRLLAFYREVPNQTQKFLHNKPVLLLPDPTLYLKDPGLKRSLWKGICQKIGSL